MGYILNPNKDCIGFYLRKRAERLAAENPQNQPNKVDKKITDRTIIKSLWDVINRNLILSGIVALVIGTLILKLLHVI